MSEINKNRDSIAIHKLKENQIANMPENDQKTGGPPSGKSG